MRTSDESANMEAVSAYADSTPVAPEPEFIPVPPPASVQVTFQHNRTLTILIPSQVDYPLTDLERLERSAHLLRDAAERVERIRASYE